MSNWILQRQDNNEQIELPEDMQWQDEFDWSDLAQSPPRYTRGGALVIQQSEKLAGRPITLSGEWVWNPRGIFKTLQAWSAVPQLKLQLERGNAEQPESFAVTFRTHEGAIACQPVVFTTPENAEEPYTGEIRLMTI